MLVNSPKRPCTSTIFTCENLYACRIRALEFGEFSLSALMIAYICFYSGHEEENSAKSSFANLFSIIMNPSKYFGGVAMSFVRVDFTSDVETGDALNRS